MKPKADTKESERKTVAQSFVFSSKYPVMYTPNIPTKRNRTDIKILMHIKNILEKILKTKNIHRFLNSRKKCGKLKLRQ